ncbi:piggyBac transposable element-derived protein 4 [Trichonephila clavipes]|nr:piggyBac transposable element-derived protein 4 [Trichonephila clavipes]
MNLQKMSLKDFRRDISRDFVSSAFVTSRNKRQTTTRSVLIKNKMPYVPQKTRLKSPVHQLERFLRRRCAACSTKAIQDRTELMCCVCKVPLCLGEKKSCFQNYHAA